MDRERRDADVLEPPREVDDGHVGLGAVADARLHRDGPGHALDHHLRHRDHRLGIAKPARARAATGDLRDPAAAVDVEEEGLRFRCEFGGFGQPIGIGAVNLNRGRRVVGRQRDLAFGALTPAQEPLDVDELGDAEIGAARATDAAEDGV